MDFSSQFNFMHRRALLQKQSHVSSILAKHLFFNNYGKPDYNLGATLDQLLGFLKFNSVEELNSVYARVIADDLADGSPMGGPRLSVANGAWIDQTLSFKHSFKQVMDNVYKAAAASVDIRYKADEVAAEVNKWAEEKTNGLIKQILPPGVVTGGTQLILANALYFKGAWNEKFDASDTKDHEFHLLNGGSVQAPLMTSRKWQYVKVFNGFKVLKLPYKQGEDKRFLSISEPGFFDQYIPLTEVRVRKFLIPKFNISFGLEASNVLKGLGLTLPFTAGLTEMVGENLPLVVTHVFHKSFIEVNEEGTEAAAVTVALNTFGCSLTMFNEEEIDFVADHPFLFLVKDETAGAILFMGTLLNPLDV
ncbi:hypothetical protein KY284_021573 [Solanum tuberosum]|nr:hypothetical protein KY284_021573 [Solanum tuberosum]